MSHNIIIDGENTIDELVKELLWILGDDDEVSGLCKLEGEHRGFEILVTVRRNDERYHA